MIRSICSTALVFFLSFHCCTNAQAVSEEVIVNETKNIQISQVEKGLEDKSLTESSNESSNILLYHPSDNIKKEIPDEYPIIEEMYIEPGSVADFKMKIIENLIKKQYFLENKKAELQKELITSKDNTVLIELKNKSLIKEDEKNANENKHTLLGNLVLLFLLLMIGWQLKKTKDILKIKK